MYGSIENINFIICFDNIVNLSLNLTSNIFEKNQALNGGALFFGNKIENNVNDALFINIENNIFKENFAENFGGAIYSNYNQLGLAISKDNQIIFNEAGIMGGGVYSPNEINKNLFNFDNSLIENNTVSSYINNYTSEPSYILLNTTLNKNKNNIITGDYFPLNFTLFDEFNNLVEDITKYYSSITFKVLMIEKNSIENDIIKDDFSNKLASYKITGNIGSFMKGKCELKNLRIFANPNTYILKFSVENYNSNIKINIDDIEIEVNRCNENQIEMHNKNILYCENPVCKLSCPVNTTATCIRYYEKDINDSKLNKFYMIFIVLKRDQKIIEDCGFIKITLFCIGILNENDAKFKFVSVKSIPTNSEIKESKSDINELEKSLVTGSQNNLKRSKSNINELAKSLVSLSHSSNALHELVKGNTLLGEKHFLNINNSLVLNEAFETKINKEKEKNNSETLSNSELSESKKSLLSNTKKNNNIDKKRRKRAIIKMFKFKEINYNKHINGMNEKNNSDIDINKYLEQNENDQWTYKCELRKYDIVFYVIELALLTIILLRGKQIMKYICIYKCTKYITYSSIIALALGPPIN
ncbi:hypothetical protein PIROE2DRAFT_4345, partial [Piromyces sp. E2]